MKKAAKKTLKREIVKAVKKDVRKKTRKGFHRILGKVALFGLVAFVSTFALYMLNLENKLIYGVIYPLLQKHYDSQVRDRRI